MEDTITQKEYDELYSEYQYDKQWEDDKNYIDLTV